MTNHPEPWLMSLEAMAENRAAEKFFVASNVDIETEVVRKKGGTEEKVRQTPALLLDRCGELGIETVHLTRGSITGANDASDCSTGIVAMSLFTTAEDYALRAAVANGMEIPPEKIWKFSSDGKPYRPKFDVNGFSACPEMDTEYRRQVIDEIYQTLMRIRVRNYTDEECRVVCAVPSIWLLLELERLMPGMNVEQICWRQKSGGNLETPILKNRFEALQKLDLSDAMGMTQTDIRSLLQGKKDREHDLERRALLYYSLIKKLRRAS